MLIRAYARPLRPLLALALGLGWASLLFHAALIAAAAAQREVRPPSAALLLGAALTIVGPWLAVAAVRSAARGRASVEADRLVLALRSRRLELPLSALRAARPWRLPLPGPGLALRLASGPPPVALEVDDPGALLDALAAAGATAAGEPGRTEAWVRARLRHRPGRLELALRWGALPLLVAGVLFHAHQAIAFGGPLGEWHLAGPLAWLRTLSGYAAASLALLVLLAAAARALAGAGCAVATALLPGRAGAARQVAEWLCRAVLYAGVPALLAARFLA
ncbi:MAG: hypothetical protein QM767_01010 [Anaeromyxobacter sp.]